MKPVEPLGFMSLIGGIWGKNGIYMFNNILFSGCSFSLFQSFWLCACAGRRRRRQHGCVWLCSSEWVCVSECVREWVCVSVWKGLWELGLESGRKAVLINGCCWVSLRCQSRQNCPAQRLLAKLALFILNIYIICVPVQFCATREKLQGACLKFIQVVISLVCFVFLFCSVLVFLVDDHSPCYGWLVSCAKKKVCQFISVHFVEEREHCDRRVIRGGGEVKKKTHTHT